MPALYDIAKRGVDLRVMSVEELREAIRQPLRAAYPDNNKRLQAAWDGSYLLTLLLQ